MRLTALALTAALLPAQEAAPPAGPAPVPAPAPVSAPAPAPRPPVDAPRLDEGLLDPAWFGEAVPFAKGDDVDFFWVKPGLDLTGRTVWMKPWDDPAMLRKGRDGKDHAKATALTDSFPGMLRGALSGAVNGKVKVSRSEGDVVLLGRFVDANAGSKAAKWLIGLGAGSETATWDLKLVDAKTGELLVALHHRAISGTAMSSIDDKLVKWADRFGTFMVQKTLK